MPEAEIGLLLCRGGRKLLLNRDPRLFAARLRPGITPQTITSLAHVDYLGGIRPIGIDTFSIDPLRRDSAMDSLRAGSETEFVTHVYSLSNDPNSRFYLSNEITVRFVPGLNVTDTAGVMLQYGLAIVRKLNERTYVLPVTTHATENPIKICNRLQASLLVEFAEPNISVPVELFHVPIDPLFQDQWHLYHQGGASLAADSHIDTVNAWEITRGDRSITIAVADDGCEIDHPDFDIPGKVVAAVDFRTGGFDPRPRADSENHGTSCCGLAVGEENGVGIVGVAPGCSLMPIRTSTELDDNSIEELCTWVIDHGASVLSCSWGPAAMVFPLSFRMEQALHRLATEGRAGKGCVILFAAGNSNRPVNGSVNEADWPTGLEGPTEWLNGFAACPDVIAVSAYTSMNRKAAYSCWGDEISVCAPSANGHPRTAMSFTYPIINSTVEGRRMVTTDRLGVAGYALNGYTTEFGGTSSAAPVVAGVAALVLSANPVLSASEVKQILEGTTDKIEDPGFDPQLGLSLGNYHA